MIAHPNVVLVSTDKLHPNRHNARTHSKKQVRQLANSIAKFGWTSPIITDENFSILAGHARYLAAQHLGFQEVPVIVVAGLQEPEKRALMLADNKIAANAKWDRNILSAELGDLAKLLPEISFDLEITGFEGVEITGLLGQTVEFGPAPGKARPSAEAKSSPAAKVSAISKVGDLWQLGPDTVLCGEALCAADIHRLLKSRAGAIMIIAPPMPKIEDGKQLEAGELAQNSDDLPVTEFRRLISKVVAPKGDISDCGAIEFVFSDWPRADEPFAVGFLLSPDLADTAVRRWQALTKRDAILAETSQTFDVVAALLGKSE